MGIRPRRAFARSSISLVGRRGRGAHVQDIQNWREQAMNGHSLQVRFETSRVKEARKAGRPAPSAWRIAYNGPEGLVLEDVGVACCSVTNDAENVVRAVADLLGPRRLFYFDSIGQLDELVVVNGRFAGFRAGAPPEVKKAVR